MPHSRFAQCETRRKTRCLERIGMLRAAILSLLFYATASVAQGTPPVLLRVPDQQEPPGGLLALKIALTEPLPIIRGMMALAFDPAPLGSIQDVALFSPTGNVSGTAVIDGGQINIVFNAPDGTLGTGGRDVTLAAIAIPVREDANPGDQSSLTLDPNASWWMNPFGETYAQEIRQGLLTVGGTLSITDVVPGSASAPAGSTIAVLGMGFQTDARVQIEGVDVGPTLFVSPTRLEVTLAGDALMHGKRIRVRNPDRTMATYDSFLRSSPVGESSRLLLARTVPIFSLATLSEAYFHLSANPEHFSALAFRNPESQTADISLDAYSAEGEPIASTTFALPGAQRISREVSELFPDAVFPSGSYVRATSTIPVQMLGLLGDDAAGTVLPVDPNPTP
jgi:hypothetical protein